MFGYVWKLFGTYGYTMRYNVGITTQKKKNIPPSSLLLCPHYYLLEVAREKKKLANLPSSQESMFVPSLSKCPLPPLSVNVNVQKHRFFQGDFRFYMDSNADVRRKVEEFLGFGEGLNGQRMV